MTQRIRKGFTLVEMIVVLTIVIIVSVIVIPFISKNNDKDIVPRGARYLTGALMQAKSRAQMERRPNGVRLLPSAVGTFNASPSGTLQIAWSSQMEYIHDVGDISEGAAGEMGVPNPSQVQFAGLSRPLNLDVLPGDYIEFLDNSQSFVIGAVAATAVTLTRPRSFQLDPVIVPPPPFTVQPNYRIIRRPRTIPGEKPMELPAGVVVDLTLPWNATNPAGGPNSFNLTANDRNQSPNANLNNTIWMGGLSTPVNGAAPVFGNPVGSNTVDIVFSPSGQIVGPGPIAANDIIYLWLHPFGEPNNWALKNAGSSLGEAANQALVVIYAKNGMITSCPVEHGTTNNPLDPYSFAKFARGQNIGGL